MRTTPFEIGATASRSQTVTMAMIRLFADASGDENPIHLDPAFAATTSYGKCIAHGMLSASLISATLANDLPGPGTVYLSQSLSFRAPVYVGDTITARVEIKARHPEKPILILATVCTNQDGTVVLEGEAKVLLT